MASLDGKIYTVTGAAQGIGLATAKLLASRGATLSLADQNEAGLKSALSSLPNPQNHMITVVDVRSSTAVDAWLSATVTKLGGLHGCANIAGVCAWGTPLAETTDETFDLVMGVNVKGIFNCTRAALSHLQRGSSVVNVASIAALKGMQGMSVYSASKHAVVGLSKSVAKEVGKLGIRVNVVAPGATDTPMLTEIDEVRDGGKMSFDWQPLGRKGDPAEIAGVIAFLLGGESSFVTGAVYSVDGGECAF